MVRSGQAQQTLKSDSFAVGGLKPGRAHPLLFFHPETKLGKVLRLRGDEKGPLVVRLESPGAISGRVINAQGRPMADLEVSVEFSPEDPKRPRGITYMDSLWKATMRNTKTNPDGQFRTEGLIPGVRYKLHVGEEEIRPGVLNPVHYYADGLTVEPGKTKDLGDLKSKLAPEKGATEKP